MFQNLQFFDWRPVTSKARSAAGKHFLITNKDIYKISSYASFEHQKLYIHITCVNSSQNMLDFSQLMSYEIIYFYVKSKVKDCAVGSGFVVFHNIHQQSTFS